jgi:photosystem II stability/assembly factor-like uncharacterized protein
MNYFQEPTVIHIPKLTKRLEKRKGWEIGMLGTKKYVVFLIFLLCAGCFYDETASPFPTETTPSKKSPTSGFSVASGAGVEVSGQSAPYNLSKMDFIDDQHGVVVKEAEGQSPSLLQTTDGGASWREASIPAFMVNAIQMDQSKSVWVMVQNACKEQDGKVNCQEEQLLQTTDSGQTWQTKWSQVKEKEAWASSRISFIDSLQGYMFVDGVLYHTQDGGNKWGPLDFGLKRFRAEHYSFINDRQGWVVGTLQSSAVKEKSPQSVSETSSQLVVLKTVDQGAHWIRQAAFPAAANQLNSVSIQFLDANRGWLLTSNLDTMKGGLYTTVDGGNHWNQMGEIRSSRPAPADMKFVGQVGWIPLDRGAGPIDGGLMVTRDGGAHFQTIGTDKGWSIHAVDLISAKQGWATGVSLNHTDYLIQTKDGGATWSQVYPVLSPSKAISFVDDLHGYGLTSGLDELLFIETRDGGHTWRTKSSMADSTGVYSLNFLDAQTGWLLTSGSNDKKSELRLTSDGGRTWEVIARDMTGLDNLGNAPFFRFFDRQNGLIATGGVKDMALLRTQDGGLTWSASSRIPLPKESISTFSFVSPTQGWLIEQGKKDEVATYFYRMDDGETWQEAGVLPHRLTPQALSFSNSLDGWLLLQNYEDGKKVQWLQLRTVDGGKTWSQQAFPETFHPLDLEMAMNVISPLSGWLLGVNGLWRTLDSGLHWSLLSP